MLAIVALVSVVLLFVVLCVGVMLLGVATLSGDAEHQSAPDRAAGPANPQVSTPKR
jgi:hypothetical protein